MNRSTHQRDWSKLSDVQQRESIISQRLAATTSGTDDPNGFGKNIMPGLSHTTQPKSYIGAYGSRKVNEIIHRYFPDEYPGVDGRNDSAAAPIRPLPMRPFRHEFQT